MLTYKLYLASGNKCCSLFTFACVCLV